MEQHINLTPDLDDVGVRLDKYISEELEEVSRSYIKKLIEGGNISVTSSNGTERRVKASYLLSEGDNVNLLLPEPEKLEIVAEDIPIDIVYEDNDVIVVNKSQGMVVHPAPGNYSGTLVNALMYHCGEFLSSINGVERPGIVHRIDKDTSGLLVICKNNLAHQSLAEQFAEHSINRIYSCIVYNHFDTDSTVVNKSIARAKNDRKKMAIDPDGRRAVTHIYLQENLKDNFAYVKCKLETGRTHQIRVHLTSINHPLLGDPVYGPKSCPYNLNGQVLHAGTLGFIHPRTNEYMEFTSDLPDYFTKLLNLLKSNQ
ncbi:23S rRNA pseudouridine1911/1915/1917 synthase [Lachnospiraceae bacterium NE2001]|nr:23S rRNA pseudouridine1911/1915/1917 synthase [Lachnospiraceae bacterium NE2001]